MLRGYTIDSVIGHGGFGIVYRARHDELEIVVAIKEYLPVELAVRQGVTVRARSDADTQGYEEGLERFRAEACALIQFHNHPNIVSCRDYFRSNGTAYLVMEFVDGESLAQVLASREAEGAAFEESDLLAVMVPLLEGLESVHAAWNLHRDIKPSNIVIRRKDRQPVLIDFGAAKQLVANRSKSMAPFTEGYAALEQVADAGELGPWTDIYGAGAVMWRMVAGGNRPWEPPNPVRVESRSHAFVRGANDPLPTASNLGKDRFSNRLLKAIDRCLTLSETERIQGCKELLGLIEPSHTKPAERDADRQSPHNPEPIEAPVSDAVDSSQDAKNDDAGMESLTLAGFGSRLVAAVVDISAIVLVIVLVLSFLHEIVGVNFDEEAITFTCFSIVLAYLIGLWTLNSATIGGLVARIRLVRSDGVPLQFADALRRGFSLLFLSIMALLAGLFVIFVTTEFSEKYVLIGLDIDWNDWQVESEWRQVGELIEFFGLAAGTIVLTVSGLFWCLWDSQKQSLHDKMAGTYVIRARRPRDIFRRKAGDR